ncbi:MAG: hypothetical protein Terrestrivirus6_48 [Terrestrivirus sp.]|uniref:Uncharacterized protein n=1 Tax=Terrestrivirus sp. TaxID=2487775 RepID=A0A3G4ZNH1_9VIRU|nr:MAG: hypothetical protein Terrestrivirus6_48 [Terrestrivirus sp.]
MSEDFILLYDNTKDSVDIIEIELNSLLPYRTITISIKINKNEVFEKTITLPTKFINWLEYENPAIDYITNIFIKHYGKSKLVRWNDLIIETNKYHDTNPTNSLWIPLLKLHEIFIEETGKYRLIELSFSQVNEEIFRFNIKKEVLENFKNKNPYISLQHFYGFKGRVKWNDFKCNIIEDSSKYNNYKLFDETLICNQ